MGGCTSPVFISLYGEGSFYVSLYLFFEPGLMYFFFALPHGGARQVGAPPISCTHLFTSKLDGRELCFSFPFIQVSEGWVDLPFHSI